jgi:hypothetical protein
MKAPPHLAANDWSYQQFANSRVLPLIALYATQMIVLFGAYAALPAFHHSTLAIIVASMALAVVGVVRGLTSPVRAASEQSDQTINTPLPLGDVTARMEGVSTILVRLTGLDVYGQSLLSRSVAAYLSSAAPHNWISRL